MDISSLLGPDSGDVFTVRTNMVSTLTGSATMNHVSELLHGFHYPSHPLGLP